MLISASGASSRLTIWLLFKILAHLVGQLLFVGNRWYTCYKDNSDSMAAILQHDCMSASRSAFSATIRVARLSCSHVRRLRDSGNV